MILIYWFLRACRWSVILGNLGINIDFTTLYLCSAVSLSMAIVTPAQSGEMLKVELLKKRGLMERFPGYSSFLFERYIDSCAIVVLAIFGLSGRMTFVRNEMLTLFLGLILAGLLTATVVVLKVRFGGRLGEIQNSLRACAKNAVGLFLILSLTMSSWTVVVLGWEICLHSISIDIGFSDSMTLMSVMTVVNIMSFIPGGMGVSEAGIAELLIRTGHSSPASQAGALAIRFYGILTVLLGAVHFLIWRTIRPGSQNIREDEATGSS